MNLDLIYTKMDLYKKNKKLFFSVFFLYIKVANDPKVCVI